MASDASPEPEFRFTPIGYLRTKARYRFEAPRQASFSTGMPAFIEFVPGHHYDVAAEDLKGFDRIWVIFCFHLNGTWRPKVRPPLAPDGGRYGVFATRSPHRPNPVGISCVELLSVEKNGLLIRNSDILDATPVLDIKPYIPEADSFPGSAAGWRDLIAQEPVWKIVFDPAARERAEWLRDHAGLDLFNFCDVQMKYRPLDRSRKRVAPLAEEDAAAPPDWYSLGCRTWRVIFSLEEERRIVLIHGVESHYRKEELLRGAKDRYADKDFHRAFRARFENFSGEWNGRAEEKEMKNAGNNTASSGENTGRALPLMKKRGKQREGWERKKE